MLKKLIVRLLKKLPKLNTFIYELGVVLRPYKIKFRNFIILDEKKLIYLINYKAACSSIMQTFIDEKVNYENLHDYDWNTIHNIGTDYKNYYSFTFVRNPYDRLVSCYKDKYYTDARIKRGERPYFSYYRNGMLKENKGFDYFVKRVCRIPHSLADAHFKSQYFVIYGKEKNPSVDFIGKFENLKKDFELVQKKFNLNELSHLNVSNKNDWMDYYSMRTAKKVFRKYRKDFIYFGYLNEYILLKEYIKRKQKE